MEQPLTPPGDRDVIICGAPRTGTSLASAVLHAPPRSVVVMEPWDGLRMPPVQLFSSLREELRKTGGLSRGKLDLAAQAVDGEVRWIREGTSRTPVVADDDAVLSVKWPTFWQYLPMLPTTRFIVCLREPAEVVASFEQAGGRLRMGLDYDVAFNRAMNDHVMRYSDDHAIRRLEMFDYIHERIAPFLARGNVYVLRYERWFLDPDVVLDELSAFIGEDVTRTPVKLRRGNVRDAEESARVRAMSRSAASIGYAAGSNA
jgi:hypothetical protein